MKILATIALVVAVSSEAAAGQSGDVEIAFRDGRVSLAAADVPAASVLAVWSKVGQTDMKGIELLGKRLVTLKVADVSEAEALQLILGREFSFGGSLKSVFEPGTSLYGAVSVATARGSWVDPEVKYSSLYSVPEAAVSAAPVAKERVYEGAWIDPEVRYQSAHGVPEKAYGDGVRSVDATTDPARWTDPETRFSYYNPFEGLEQPKAEPSKTTDPATWVDPEVRFQRLYAAPNKSVKPAKTVK